MSKRRWMIVAGPAVIAIAAAIWWGLRPRHNITFDAYLRIRAGITLKEVETLLGATAGDYRSPLGRRLAAHRRRFCSLSLKQLPLAVVVNGRRRTMKFWKSDETTITVWFDNGRVISARAAVSPFQYANVVDFMRSCLGI